jgi:geranylgeranyl diphosphate synthase type II
MTVIEIQQLIKQELKDLNWKIEPQNLYTPIEYVLSLGGKRIRPVAALLACQLFDPDIRKALYPALAIEVFHNFTLLHDDIMDKAEMRRNKPTVHIKWNDNTAILSGDAMLIKAYQLLAKCDPSVLKKVLDIFSRTSVEVCEGQQYDMEFEQREDVSLEDYLKMIRLKTAVLLAGSLKIGAICGGASKEDTEYLYQFGINIGISFQLWDDYLDVYGNPDVFGKNIGGDISNNKKTFLLINALEKADAGSRKELRNWINDKKADRNEKIKAVTDIYNKLDIPELTLHAVHSYYEQGLALLKKVSIPEERKKELYTFTQNLLERDS